MTPRQQDTWIVGLLTATLVFCLIVLPLIRAHFESRTYNRLTGAHTTWWDAMWVELRIQESPSK